MVDIFLNKVQSSVVSILIILGSKRLILKQFFNKILSVLLKLFLRNLPLKLVGLRLADCFSRNSQQVEQ